MTRVERPERAQRVEGPGSASDRSFETSMNELRKVLVVMPTWVGDAVMATPLLEAIARAMPAGGAIDLLIKRPLRGLLDGMTRLVRVIEWQKSDGMWRLSRRLHPESL